MNDHSTGERLCISLAVLLLGLVLLPAQPAAASLRLLSLPANDLVYDAGRHRLYASVAAKAGAQGNSVAVIDPETGAIGPTIPVGPDPGKLALSDDGHYLYVGLDGPHAVRRVDLQTGQPDLQFSLGNDMFGPLNVEDMQVVPGSPRSVAIARRRLNVSPAAAGVVVYDEGQPRPKQTDRSDVIQFSASPSRLYGLITGGGTFLERMSLDQSGVNLVDDTLLYRFVGDYNFRYADGRLYLSSGNVVDPEARQVIDTFPGVPYPSLVLPDLAVDRVYFLTFSRSYSGPPPTLLAYDRRTLRLAGSQVIPVSGEQVDSFVLWGSDGIAFRTGDQVTLLRTRLRTPDVRSADLAVTGIVSPNPVRVGGTVTYQLQVRNYGPDAETNAMVASSLPAGTAFVSLATSQGRCFRTGRRLTCELGALPAGARAVLTLTVRPALSGPLLHTATVSGEVSDPLAGNNTATEHTTAVLPTLPSAGAGALLPVLGVEARQVALAARDLVYDRVTRRIYASVPSRAGAIGNSVVPIDPRNGAVGTPIPVGSEPNRLALSDDGHYLYVGLDGAGAVRRVDLRAQTAGLQFSLASFPAQGTVTALDLQVVPGDPEAVAVTRRHGPGPYGIEPVTIYDSGVPRPGTPRGDAAATTEIQFSASSSRLYGHSSELGFFGLYRLAVDELGAQVIDGLPVPVAGTAPAMRFDQGLLVSSTGAVIDPEAGQLLGSVADLGYPVLMAPDAAAGQLFYLTGQGRTRVLRVYDPLTLLPSATIGIAGVRGQPGSLIRWGQEAADDPGGLAFLTDAGQVFLLRLLLAPPADLALGIDPGAVFSGNPAVGTVTLSRPAPSGGAVVLLASANREVVSIPDSVTVPARARTATFAIKTRPVTEETEVELTASFNGIDRSVPLRLLPQK